MPEVEFRGDQDDLQRFARGVLPGGATLRTVSEWERRLSWDAGGSTGSSSAVHLRTGMELHAVQFRWENPWRFRFHDAPTPLKFLLSRGEGPTMHPVGGRAQTLGPRHFQVRRTTARVSRMRTISSRSESDDNP